MELQEVWAVHCRCWELNSGSLEEQQGLLFLRQDLPMEPKMTMNLQFSCLSVFVSL